MNRLPPPLWCLRLRFGRAPRSHAEAVWRLRQHFAFFGHHLDDLSDEQIGAGIVDIGNTFGRYGVSSQEMQDALSRLARTSHP